MANLTEAAYQELRDGLTIGPDHHRYQLIRQLRDHFMGSLWLAEDISTAARTEVSLLILRPELIRHEGLTERMRKLTIRLRPALHHPHIATCYGYFSWRGLEFLSLERLDGQTLSDLFQRNLARKLNDRQKQGLLIQLAKALDTAQLKLGEPHALLAPDLIFLNTGGGVKLTGFGWRPLLDPLWSQLPLPPEYPCYQAPEAFQSQKQTARSDVYALALIAWELYSGKRAFQPGDDENARSRREFKAPPGLNKTQWTSLARALNPEAETRPDSCLALVRSLFATEPSPDQSAIPDMRGESPEPDSTRPAAAAVTASPPPASPAGAANRLLRSTSRSRPAASPSGTGSPENRSATWPVRLLHRCRQLPAAVRIWAGASLIFVLGVMLGFWLAWQLLQPQLDAISAQALAQMKHNRELRAALASPEQSRAPQQPAAQPQQGTPVQAPPTLRVESASALRAANRPVDNLVLFQDELKDGGYGPQMVVIPAGRFLMGDLHGNGDDNERPVHQVVIDKSFALARQEVTFAEYDRFASATGRPLPDDEGWGRGNRPVINVSWNDAHAYTLWLAEQTGQPYRLPTEAEWEYSARAGTETIYWWGDLPGDGYAVCDGCDRRWGGRQTAPVGSTRPNPWGLYDLNGNVDEWVLDCYQPDYTNAPADGSATQTSDCSHRVMRGGSWFDIPRVVRPASRYRHPATSSRNSWGFRVALDLPDSMQ